MILPRDRPWNSLCFFFCYLNLKPEDLACTEHFIFVKWNSFSHALASPQWLLKGSLPTITSLVFCGALFPCIYWTYYIVRRILSAWFKIRKYGSRQPDCTNTTIGGQSVGFGRVSCSSTKRGKEGKKKPLHKVMQDFESEGLYIKSFSSFLLPDSQFRMSATAQRCLGIIFTQTHTDKQNPS